MYASNNGDMLTGRRARHDVVGGFQNVVFNYEELRHPLLEPKRLETILMEVLLMVIIQVAQTGPDGQVKMTYCNLKT